MKNEESQMSMSLTGDSIESIAITHSSHMITRSLISFNRKTAFHKFDSQFNIFLNCSKQEQVKFKMISPILG